LEGGVGGALQELGICRLGNQGRSRHGRFRIYTQYAD
jgi:hypothetical protein